MRTKTTFLLFMAFFALQVNAKTYYVATTGDDTNTGTSWDTAFATLQKAIDTAVSYEDEVWVATGTYLPTKYPNGETHDSGGTPLTDRDKTFFINKQIKIYGGFAGTETSISQRNVGTNQTILSGDLLQNDADNLSGWSLMNDATRSDNVYHVIMSSNYYYFMDGFVIKGGNANVEDYRTVANAMRNTGGGIFSRFSVGTFNNIVLESNYGAYGGGVYSKSSLNFSNAVIYNNSANIGSAIDIVSNDLTISNATIFKNIDNDSPDGAIYMDRGNLRASNTIFWQNSDDVYASYASLFINHCMTQTHSQNITNIVGEDPYFINENNPKGNDGLWMTPDDGLIVKRTSKAINAGINYKLEDNDILGNPRLDFNTVDIGAYEYNLQANYYVSKSGNDSNTGNSWNSAFLNVQTAIDAAAEGDIIWVAKGTYTPTTNPEGGSLIQNETFHLESGVKVYGGFAGAETRLEDRDIAKYETILSGMNDRHHVVLSVSDNNQTVLNGFTITGGKSNGTPTAMTVENEIITANYGAGIYLVKSDVELSNLKIHSNNSSSVGGGLYADQSQGQLINSALYNNSASGKGGAMMNQSSNMRIRNIVFYDNSSQEGGAVYNSQTSSYYLGCTFYDNSVSVAGGAVQNNSSNVTISSSIFWNNKLNNSAIANGADVNGTCTIENSITQEGSSFTTGLGVRNNIDPLFMNEANIFGNDGIMMTDDDGLKLRCMSPAINTGFTNVFNTKDIIGATRIIGQTVDMGAYESTKTSALPTQLSDTNIPLTAGMYRSEMVIIENNWKHYCRCSGELLLSLNVGNSGAVIPDNGVTVKVEKDRVAHYANGVGFVNNPLGITVLNNSWNVEPKMQPSTGNVEVRSYFATGDLDEINRSLSAKGGNTLNSLSELNIYKVTKPGAHIPVADLNQSDVIELVNNDSAGVNSTTKWLLSNDTHDYASFKVSSFSGGFSGGSASSVLPVELLSFDVAKSSNGVILKWSTASEINNKGFDIERSTDGVVFEKINFINGSGSTVNRNDYMFIDSDFLSGKYYYRLVQRDYDGKKTLSDIRFINVGFGTSYTLYPNPVAQNAQLVFKSNQKANIDIRIYSAQGLEVKRLSTKVEKGNNNIDLELDNLIKGLYLMNIVQDGKTSVVKLIKE